MYRVCVHIHMAARISARQARIIFERISDVSDVTSGDETWDSARTLLQVEHFELVEQLIDHGVLEYPEDSLALEFYEKTKALGLEWKNVGATEPCLGRRLNNEALTKALKSKTEALGSKWKAVSLQKPMEGSEITNDALAAKLQLQQLTFTQKEWDEFALPPIGSDDYIRAGRQYFQPALEFTKKEWNAFGVVDLRSDDFIECDGAFFKPASKNSVSAIGPEERAEIDQDFQQELKRLAQEGAGQVENARQDDALAGDPLSVLREYVQKASLPDGTQKLNLNLITRQLLSGAQLCETHSIFCRSQHQLVHAVTLLEEALVNKVMVLGSDDPSVTESLIHFRGLLMECSNCDTNSTDEEVSSQLLLKLARILPFRVFDILRSRNAPDPESDCTIDQVVKSMSEREFEAHNVSEWGCSAIHSLVDANTKFDDQRQSVLKAALCTLEKHLQHAGAVRESLVVILDIVKVVEITHNDKISETQISETHAQYSECRQQATNLAIQALEFYTYQSDIHVQKSCLKLVTHTHEQVNKGTTIPKILSSLGWSDCDPEKATLALNLLVKLCSSDGSVQVWAKEEIAMHDGDAIIRKVIDRHPEVKDCGEKCLKLCQESIKKRKEQRREVAKKAQQRYEKMNAMVELSRHLDGVFSSFDPRSTLSLKDLEGLHKERTDIREQCKKLKEQYTFVGEKETKKLVSRLEKLDRYLAARYFNASTSLLESALRSSLEEADDEKCKRLKSASTKAHEYEDTALNIVSELAADENVFGEDDHANRRHDQGFKEEFYVTRRRKSMFSKLEQRLERSIAAAAPATKDVDHADTVREMLDGAKSYLFLNWQISPDKPKAGSELDWHNNITLAETLSGLNDKLELKKDYWKEKKLSSTLKRLSVDSYMKVGNQYFQPLVTAGNLENAKAQKEAADEFASQHEVADPDVSTYNALIDKAEKTFEEQCFRRHIEDALREARQMLLEPDFQGASAAYVSAALKLQDAGLFDSWESMLADLDHDFKKRQSAYLAEGDKAVTSAFNKLEIENLGGAEDDMKRVAQMTENLRENPPKSDDNSDIRGQLELLLLSKRLRIGTW